MSSSQESQMAMLNQQVPQQLHPLAPSSTQIHHQDDEMSLIDLWIAISRHKKLVLAVFALVVTLGLIVAFAIPKSYSYSTVIEISKYWGGNSYIQLDDQDSVKSKLEKIYIPQVMHSYDPGISFDVKAHTPKNTNLVILISKSNEADAELIRTIHDEIVKNIAKEHADQLTSLRQIYQSQLKATQVELQSLESKSSDASLMMLIEKNRHINDLSLRIENMWQTYAPTIAIRSTEPTSPSKALVVVLAIFLGLFAGLLAVLIAEFRNKILERTSQLPEE